MDREMDDVDVEKGVAAAEAKGRREQEVARLLKTVRGHLRFLYLGTLIVMMAPRLTPPCCPAAVPGFSSGHNLLSTCAVFAAVTLLVQEKLERVLERRPAPAPRLTPLGAWPVGIATWMFVRMFFIGYLTFGDGYYFVRSCFEWAAAAVASVANLAMATRTVMRHLA